MDTLNVVIISALSHVHFGSSILTHEDLKILQQNNLASQLLRSVDQYIPIGNSYMRQEFYLGQWLKAFQFDMQKTSKHLQEELMWRNINHMDTILYEDFSCIQAEYQLNSIDALGRPILLIPFESFDFRQAIVTGKRHQMERFVLKMFEDVNSKLREVHKRNPNVTGFVGYTNLKGFDVVRQGCRDCIPFYTSIVQGFEKHYPHSVGKYVIFNRSFEGYLKGMKSAMSNDLLQRLKVYGTNRNTWPDDLRQFVANNEAEE